MSKLNVGLLGKRGLVGQTYEKLLRSHPYFELVFAPLREELGNIEKGKVCDLIFSALTSEAAKKYDPLYADLEVPVLSSASFHRLQEDVPLIIPEINGAKLKGWKGSIIAKPNCTLQSMLLPLYPLHQRFGLKEVSVTNLQSISGAGSHFTLSDNVIPFIEGEEEKSESESLKILDNPLIRISTHCIRVPVLNGHLACISASFEKKPTLEEVRDCWDRFKGLQLPSSPEKIFVYFEQEDRPQPELDVNIGKGMAIALGRLRACSLFDIRFISLSHNLIRGAAGGGLLIAELYAKENLL
ncbi:MAG: aspartate-semialdehyde dehydrogenase [Candidatus Neptunochlamydia sp.]|nr:aspartate-semialdehyde dehydrogenase [Candidatus Neptunochlamydia sp.]